MYSGKTSGCFVGLVSCLLLVLSAASAQADQAPVVIELPAEGVVAGVKHQALTRADPGRELDPAHLLRSDTGFEAFDPGLDESANGHWLKLHLAAGPDSGGEYVLRVARRFFRTLELYAQSSEGGLRFETAAFDRRVTAETVGREFAFEVAVRPGEEKALLIYVNTIQGSLQPLELWIQDRAGFDRATSRTNLMFGLLFGILLALIFHNLILYLSLRQRGHLFYVLAMSSLLLLLGLDSGMLQTYLWPAALAEHTSRINIVASVLVMLSISLFFLAFTKPRRHAPGLARFVEVVIGLLAVAIVVLMVVPTQYLLNLAMALQPVQLATQLLLLVGAFVVGRRGSTEGYIFLAAWSVFIVSGFSRVFISLDVLPRTVVLDHAMYFGAVIEASILALGLTWRVRQLHERHEQALEEQYKAARLANLDPLTDAYNRRFLQTYLESVMPDSSTDSFGRAVLILDLDNFKEANDEYGHAAGDQVLRDLVRRCQRVLRERDVMCRLGGDEFVIVLSDQAEQSGLQVARRILSEVASQPFLFEGQPMPVTTSIGVVSSISPKCAVSDIMRMADQALYQAKQAGRNQAVLFDPDQATPFRQGPSREPERQQT